MRPAKVCLRLQRERQTVLQKRRRRGDLLPDMAADLEDPGRRVRKVQVKSARLPLPHHVRKAVPLLRKHKDFQAGTYGQGDFVFRS